MHQIYRFRRGLASESVAKHGRNDDIARVPRALPVDATVRAAAGSQDAGRAGGCRRGPRAGRRASGGVLARPRGATGAGRPADHRCRGRPRGRRRWLHRLVGGAAGQGGRPRARGRAARGAHLRLGGVRAQRRVLRGQPHARAEQRPRPASRTRSTRSSAWARRTSTRSRRRWRGTASTAASSAPASSRSRPSRYQLPLLADDVEAARRLRSPASSVLDRDAVRAEVDSPTYRAAAWFHDRTALVDPARLAWGLRRGVPRARRADLREHPGAAAARGPAPVSR